MMPMPSWVSSTVTALRGRTGNQCAAGRVAGEEGVQHQRRQGEVVDVVDVRGDLDLLRVVPVHLDEHLGAALVRARRDEVSMNAKARGVRKQTVPGFLTA